MNAQLAGPEVRYLLAGGCQWHGAKSFLGPAEVRINAFDRRTQQLSVAKWLWWRALTAEVLVRFLQSSQILAAKKTPIPAIRDRFPGGETYQF